jgi:hypothetical protein
VVLWLGEPIFSWLTVHSSTLGFTLGFAPDFGHPNTGVRINRRFEYFDMSIAGKPRMIEIISTDRGRDRCTRLKYHQFLALARDERRDFVCYSLLLVHVQNQFAVRGVSLRLMIPSG